MGIKSRSQTDNQQHDIMQWACKELSSCGYKLNTRSPEIVCNTPWSYVIRFITNYGYVYLKHVPALIALESNVIQILHGQFHVAVPIIIAQNSQLNCFLMKDAGVSLRSILKVQFDTALLCKAVEQFTSLQMIVADHVNIFIDIGVPDWRLNKIPDLYKEIILQKDFLRANDLTEMEIAGLEILSPKVAILCQKLSNYSIKQTIVQPDFSDNNILIANSLQDVTFIDMGEVAISHPFFSLINCLQVIKRHHALVDTDESYLRIRNAYLGNFVGVESTENVFAAFELAQPVWFVYALFAHHRLMQACDKEKLMILQHGKLKSVLKDFMAACAAVDNS
jgi:hypothetical protein